MADNPEDDKAQAPAAPSTAPGKKLPIVAILLVLNSVLMAGVLAVVLLRSNSGAASVAAAQAAAAATNPAATAAPDSGHAPKAEAPPAPSGHGSEAGDHPGPTLRLADFIIHLRNSDTDRYVRLSFDVEVGTEKDKTELADHLAPVRESFISYLSDRTLDDLRGSEGLRQTKEALLSRLKMLTPGIQVRALYITDFIVQ